MLQTHQQNQLPLKYMFYHLIKTNEHQKLQVVFCLYFLSHQGGGASQKVSLPSSQWYTLVKGPNVKKGCELSGTLSRLLRHAGIYTARHEAEWRLPYHLEITKCLLQCHHSFRVGPTVPEPNPEAKLWLIAEHVSSAAHLRKDD